MFEMRYPHESSPTPTNSVDLGDPEAPASRFVPDEGIIGDELGDGLEMHTTKVGSLVNRNGYQFRGLTHAKRAEVEAFKAAVGGRAFRYRENDPCGWNTSWTWVKFALEGGYALQWTWRKGWSVFIPLRTVSAP
jgi:hypothetical protein